MRILSTLLAIFLLAPGVAAGSAAGELLDEEALLRIFEKYVTALTPWPKADLEIRKFRIVSGKINPVEGEIEYRMVGNVPDKHPGYKNLELAISAAGKELGRVKLSGELHRFGTVACTVNKVDRGDVLRREDIRMIRSDLTWQSAGVIFNPENAVGKRLRNSLRAGSVLLADHLAEQPLVSRGDTVTIMAGRASLMVTAPGRVREDGTEGELVRVKNMMSRKVLLARVRDDRTVVVDY